MRAMLTVVTMVAASPAMAQGVPLGDTTGKDMAATSGEVVRNSTLAVACRLRDEDWRTVIGVTIGTGMLQLADKSPRDFASNGNKQAAKAYVSAIMIQAARDGRAEYARYADAGCTALKSSGMLVVLDTIAKSAGK